MITVEAMDAAGNTSTYETRVLRKLVMASYPLTENFALQDIRLLLPGEVDKFLRN